METQDTPIPSRDPYMELADFIEKRLGEKGDVGSRPLPGESPDELPERQPLSAFRRKTLPVKLFHGIKNSLMMDSLFGYLAQPSRGKEAINRLMRSIDEKRIHERGEDQDVENQASVGDRSIIDVVSDETGKERSVVVASLKSAFEESNDLFRAAQNASMSRARTVSLYFFVSRPNLKELLTRTLEALDESHGDATLEEFKERAKEIAQDVRAAATPTGAAVDALARQHPSLDENAFRNKGELLSALKIGDKKFDFKHTTKVGFINPTDDFVRTPDQHLLNAMSIALTQDGNDWPQEVSSLKNVPIALEVRNDAFDETRHKLIRELTVNETLPLKKTGEDWIDKSRKMLQVGQSRAEVKRAVNGVCTWPLFEALASGQEYRLSSELLSIVDAAPVCRFHSPNKAVEDHANRRFNDQDDAKMIALKRRWVGRSLLTGYNDPESVADAAKVLAFCLVASGGADQLADHLLPEGGPEAVAARMGGLAVPDLLDNGMGVYPEVKANLDAQGLNNSARAIWEGIKHKNVPGSLIARRGFYAALGGTLTGMIASLPAGIMNSLPEKRNPLLTQLCGWLPSSLGTASGIPINYGLTLPDIRLAYEKNLLDEKYRLPRGIDPENVKEVREHCDLMAMNELMARSGMANASGAFNMIPYGIVPPFIAAVANAPVPPIQTVQSVYSPMTENIFRLALSWINGGAIHRAERDLEMQMTTRAGNGVDPIHPDALRRYSHNGFSTAGTSLTHKMSWPVRRFFSNDPYGVDLRKLVRTDSGTQESPAVRKLRAQQKRVLSSGSRRITDNESNDQPREGNIYNQMTLRRPGTGAGLEL